MTKSVYVRKGSAYGVGSCNACGNTLDIIFEIALKIYSHGIVIRLCSRCLMEIIRQARKLGFRTKGK